MVFDLDGTLLSCRPRQMAALRAVCGLTGTALPAIWQAKRDGATTRDALLAAGMSATTADQSSRRWGQVIETPYFLAYDSLLPGASEALRVCRAAGLRTVILTARKSLRGLLMQANALQLNCMADEILAVDPRDGVAGKALQLQRLAPIALIGDSEVDARAAAAAAVPFVPVSSGQRSPGFLRRTLGLCPFDGVLPATLATLAALIGDEPTKQP